MTGMPAYLDVPPEKLGSGTPVRVRVVGDMASLARDMADVMLGEIRVVHCAGWSGGSVSDSGGDD